MAVMWDLVSGRNFNPVGQFQQGYQGGQQLSNDRQKRSVLAELAQMGPDADLSQAAMRVMAVDPQTGMSLANLAGSREDRTMRRETRAEDMDWRRQESARAQQNADRSFGMQQENAQFQRNQAGRPNVKFIKDAQGMDVPVLVGPDGSVRPIQMPGGNNQPTNPFAPGGKMTEGQSNAALYGTRMAESHGLINQLEGINKGTSGALGGTAEALLPSAAFNQMAGPDRQKFMQAKRNFVNAALRRESGAAISPSEFASAEQQYFPQPGDGPEVIEQKRQNRETAIKGIMGAAGPSYRPPQNFQPGQQQPQPQPQPQQQPQITEGQTATNPQTGQKIMLRGGQWVPAQ